MRILKSIKYRCVQCRKLDLKVGNQIVGCTSKDRLKPVPAGSYTSLDIFGPLEIKVKQTNGLEAKGME